MFRNAMVLVTLFLLMSGTLPAEQLYQKTEPLISNLLKADSFSTASLNFQSTALVKRYLQYMPSIDYVARPQLKLAGLRFNPRNYTSIVNSYVNKLSYFEIKTKFEKEIKFPENTIITRTSWSEDGKNLLVGVETPACYQLWVVAIPSLRKKLIPNVCINEIMGGSFTWVNTSEVLIFKRTNEQNKELIIEKSAPVGPVVQESKGVVAQNRTYPDLLKNQNDEKTLSNAIRSQLVIYNIKTGSVKNFGPVETYAGVSVSPDRSKFLVTKIIKPYSYVVPIGYFAKQSEVWDSTGHATHKLFKSGPYENIPINGVATGPRRLSWLPDEPATLMYVEALDGGDWKNKVDFRDEIFKLLLQSNGKTKSESIYKTKNRFGSLDVLDRNLGYLIEDYERDSEWVTTKLVKYENSKVVSEKTVFSFNENDEYGNPGSAYTVYNKYKRFVIAVENDNQNIFLAGKGATPQGYRPFLNKFNLNTLQSKEVFRSDEKTYESFLTFTDDVKFNKFLTSFETNTQSPRMMFSTISENTTKKELLYADKNPFAIMAGLKKEVIKYKRNDGVELSGILYYPLNYEAGKKYPLIIDAYPLEYTDSSTAGQVRSTQYKFETPYRADVIYFALRGYAVLQDAQIPIIGHPETKNDTFLPQLIAGAEAAIKAVEAKNIIDTKKVGVVGHSYGGFMVANLLTHTKLFAAGIARSGAYNRTLTPFGFQGERRTFWDAKETYLKVSPFYEAEKMKYPMLLIHGQADNNSGTFTLQSERYFDALKGQGANVRLVLLPEESHSYAAIESVEHVLFEMFNWFDTYLKK